MSRQYADTAGFSVVELLVTLFIAAAFLSTGYVLYRTVVGDSGDMRMKAQASGIAYDYLRQYESTVDPTCSASNPLENEPLTVDGLADVTVSVSISCPNAAITSLSKVQTTVTYTLRQETKEVSHAIYATN